MTKTSAMVSLLPYCAQWLNASSKEAYTSQPGNVVSVALTTMLRRPGRAPWGSDSKVCLPMMMA